ncbi:hypothetical protein A1O7_03365 [Cladophialophora yegresii CBS 114405]|uniref:Uncharacterized protein n=1 Tax=Cladophialophora yegresii CBS 114405 TaxID=1182544 RepID=W9W4C3_9EURO|nr:uncharacterized protein A1O7_03365 [Cladophialophora yegresii CBS 114405]EXJ62922.1 hypothetical protein A1O7_03365 [Cladophialophora yegresii CBS 114405]
MAHLVVGLPAALPNNPGALQRADVSYSCDCIDHWFQHGRFWIRASSDTGCMSLETIPQTIYALNAIAKPDYFSNDYPNLICSLDHHKCEWTYSPLDSLANTPSSPDSTTSGIHLGERDISTLEKVDGPFLLPHFVTVPSNQAPQKR